MNLIKALLLIAALASLDAAAAEISISATAGSKGISLIPERNQPQPTVSMVEGRKAWTCKTPANRGMLVGFKISEDDYKDGGHPSVVFTIDYLDQGSGPVNLVYDSLVETKKDGGKPDTVKSAGMITLADTKTWKKATFTVTDARFDDRCGDVDFRMVIPKDREFILGGVSIAPGTAPASVVWHQALRGKLFPGSFDTSKIFPGSVHRIMVYVPKQYDPAKPACVYVSQDGMKPTFPSTLNRLIFEKQMPVTVGIFISPGNMDAPSKEQGNRSNRCYEYDSLGGEYARFILDEVIPYVEKTFNLKLSQNGNDRGIGGASSGGICAFNAAWERPDGFRRVYTSSGSLVAFRGGDILPLLVRECEPKPLRIYAFSGNDDMANSGGNWTLQNRELDRALKFSGYDYTFTEYEGKHCVNYVDNFSEGMKWLWRDWPAPVKSGAGGPRLQDILIPNEGWTPVAQGLQKAQGLAVNPKGEVFFSDSAANRIYKIGTDGKLETFLSDAQKVNALTFGPDGTLYGVAQATGNVLAFDAKGQARIIANGIRGHDLTATRAGGLYITESGPEGAAESKVWFISPKGEKSVVDTGLQGATGVAVSADGWLLNVADGRTHWVYSCQINADGTLANKQRLYWLHKPDDADDSGVDGLCVDRGEGLLYTATRMGIQVLGLQGHMMGIVSAPGSALSSVCLGGANFDVLYAACGDKVYKRKVKVKGLHAFDEPVKPLPGKL